MAFMDQDGFVKPVRLTADGAVPVADVSPDDVLAELLHVMRALLHEQRATRLAVQELVNAGLDDKTDFLEMAQDQAEGD